MAEFSYMQGDEADLMHRHYSEQPKRMNMDEVIAELNRLADGAYINYAAMTRMPPCLGETIKMEKGQFGAVELQAHRSAARELGRHQALHTAIKLLRSCGCIKGSDNG